MTIFSALSDDQAKAEHVRIFGEKPRRFCTACDRSYNPDCPDRWHRMSEDERNGFVRMTFAELSRLSEYSLTLPTATTIGKKWRCHDPYVRSCPSDKPCEHWWLGEYATHPTDPKKVRVLWFKIHVEG